MFNALTKSLDRSRIVASTAMENAQQLKAAGVVSQVAEGGFGLGSHNQWQSQAKYRERYGLFRGVLYSAVNALAMEGSEQPFILEQIKGMTKLSGTKKAGLEKEILEDHPLVETLRRPNPIQDKFQFIYSFIASLNLTGWGYIVGGKEKDRLELYSLPSSWVTPIHKKGPFSSFLIKNPRRPDVQGEELGPDRVAFAQLPNPADPLLAFSPAGSQMPAIRVDDFIWDSRQQFFKNGIFPGSIVTVGKDPHPDNSPGTRPRLTAGQRRQVNAAIRKLMGGIANYGNPAIVDGLIESIQPLSMASNEMGWEKSEKSTKAAILSAFCVHPYILGEAVSVGGYAQVANIEKRFCKRVNVFLDMLGVLLTNFIGTIEQDPSLIIRLEKCTPSDPALEWSNWKFARLNGDISQNELREKLGLPPDEDNNESVIAKQLLAPITQLLDKKASGAITKDQVEGLLKGLGLPDELAEEVAGEEVKPPEPEPVPGKLEVEEEKEEPEIEELKKAIEALREIPEEENDKIVELLS